MRKVTASAVILTALTGCSQSSIPSTQWSFDVPTEEGVASADATEGTLASAELVASSLEKDSSSTVGSSAGGRMMGPAFEQPEADAIPGAKLSTVGRPSSKEVSGLTGETYGLANGLASGLASTSPSTRPDPVAQVRAYLRSSGSPSALTNRTPYASQVYLSSLPIPNQYAASSSLSSSPTGSTTNLPSVLEPSALGFTESLPNSEIASSPETLLPIPDFATPNLSAEVSLDGLTAPASVASTFESVAGNDSITSRDSSDISSASSANASSANISAADDMAADDMAAPVRFEDGLPQLVSSVSASPTDMPAQNVSIGTTILNNLQRSSSAPPIDTVVADSTAKNSYQQIPIQDMPAPVISAPVISAPATPLSDSVPSSPESVVSDLPAEAAAVTYQPAVPQQATLASLTENMPSRELSPLVASYRAAQNLDYSTRGESSVDLRDATPLRDLDTSSNPSSSSSPLLQSFSGDADVSTLYVPIAEPAASDISGTLIQEAMGALEEEVSNSDFLNGLLQQGTFSSILSSTALVSDRPSQAAPAIITPSASTVAPSIAQRIPLATSKRPAKRRQRVMWL